MLAHKRLISVKKKRALTICTLCVVFYTLWRLSLHRSFGWACWFSLQVARFTSADLNCSLNTEAARRIAHVVSIDTASPRYLQTERILTDVGFSVAVIHPPHVGESSRDYAMSNKLGLLAALEKIALGSETWGYIFEDDIITHESWSNTTITDIIASESSASLFQYLGICALDLTYSRKMCGRCTHAMGFSQKGAAELLLLAKQDYPKLYRGDVPRDEVYLDVIMEYWCKERGPFPVFGPLENSMNGTDGHLGMFIQDRKKFESIIDAAPAP